MTENHDVTAALSELGTEAAAPASTDNFVPKERVTEIVREAFNRGQQKGLSMAGGMGGMPAQQHPMPIDKNAVSQMVGEAFNQHKAQYDKAQYDEMQRREGERQLKELSTKVDAAAPKYEDYNKVTGQHDWSQMPEVLHYANSVDNAGDVLYDLSKNPSKLATIRGLPPGSAALEIKKLSDSIKQNEAAAKDASNVPPSPGSQLKPSNLASDKQPSTAAEYAARYKGRG